MRLKILFLFAGLVLSAATAAGETAPVEYVGRSVCTECHESQAVQWSGSHHDLAMQPATVETVQGNFDDASLTQYGVTPSFYKKDGRFMVKTEGPDGKLQNFEIKYTFGVEPLQQYLI
jgi:hypothetical protein